MSEPYRRPPAPDPRRRRLVLALGVVVTVLVLAGVTWSIFVWPSTCGAMLTTADAGQQRP